MIARTQKVRAFRGMKKFVKFTLIWISQNLAIPFWIVGHIHLSVNIYEDLHELLSSISMNLIVLIGTLTLFKDIEKDGVTKDDVFLDIGSGYGKITKAAAEYFNIKSYGIELDKEKYKISKKINIYGSGYGS